MSKTILVAGYGPGISDAVARKWGAEGYRVAIVGRSQDRLDAGVAALAKANIAARGFRADVSDANAVRTLIKEARAGLGPIAALHWNAYSVVARDLLKSSDQELSQLFHVGVNGLVVAVQSVLSDLIEAKGAVLITGGGLAFYDPQADKMAVDFQAAGLALVKAAQHKLTGVLNKQLAAQGVYVGEVTVTGLVKGTAFDHGNATIDPAHVADAFWQLAQKRSEVYATV